MNLDVISNCRFRPLWLVENIGTSDHEVYRWYRESSSSSRHLVLFLHSPHHMIETSINLWIHSRRLDVIIIPISLCVDVFCDWRISWVVHVNHYFWRLTTLLPMWVMRMHSFDFFPILPRYQYRRLYCISHDEWMIIRGHNTFQWVLCQTPCHRNIPLADQFQNDEFGVRFLLNQTCYFSWTELWRFTEYALYE